MFYGHDFQLHHRMFSQVKGISNVYISQIFLINFLKIFPFFKNFGQKFTSKIYLTFLFILQYQKHYGGLNPSLSGNWQTFYFQTMNTLVNCLPKIMSVIMKGGFKRKPPGSQAYKIYVGPNRVKGLYICKDEFRFSVDIS